MKIFGVSIWLVVMLLAAFTIGAKNPALLTRIPFLNKI